MLSQIKRIITSSDVVLFMKGTLERPQCGFSKTAVDVFKAAGVPFSTVDVLADDSIRQAVKEYSRWPTIPQAFVKGEFVGGCDIILQMHKSGELASLLKKHNII